MEKERWRKRDITQDGGGGRKNGVLRARPADSESEWRNDVENVITASI